MAKLSTKIVIYKKNKTPEQEATIAIRVGFMDVYRYRETDYHCKVAEFDEDAQQIKKAHPNHEHANAELNKLRYQIQSDLLILKKEPTFNIRTIEKYLDPGDSIKRKSFSLFVNDYCRTQGALYEKTKGKDGRSPGTIRNYEKSLRKLHRFAGKENVLFHEITTEFLEEYMDWMLSKKEVEPGERKNRGHKQNGYTTVWDSLTKFMKKFLKEAGYPVPTFKWPQSTGGTVEYITLAEVDLLEAALPKLSGSEYEDALYFLIECYSGIRHSDWKRFSIEQLVDGDNFKVRAKKNGEPVYLSLANRPRLASVLQLAKQTPYTGTLEVTNRNLKIIGPKAGVYKRLSTHVGRHTCGVLHAEKGFSIEYVSELLGITIRSCDVYYKITRQKLRREDERLQGL